MSEETAAPSAAPEAVQSSTPESSVSRAQEPSSVHTHKLGESQPEGQQKQNGKRPESRYERTKRERAEFRRQKEQFDAERRAFHAERAQAQQSQQAPKRDYTLADLQKYRAQWEAEGNFDLVEKADKEIAVLQAEEEAARKARTVELPPMGSPEHRQAWQAAEAELYQADPEFMREGTPLDKALRAIMASEDGNIYRQHPRGIVAAYHRAKMELLSAQVQRLQEENKRLNGLTSLGNGAPAKVGGDGGVSSLGDFARLSTKDMRKHLLKGVNRGATPWF